MGWGEREHKPGSSEEPGQADSSTEAAWECALGELGLTQNGLVAVSLTFWEVERGAPLVGELGAGSAVLADTEEGEGHIKV